MTLDADFHRLLLLSRSMGPSVIRIRIEGLKGREIAALLTRVLNTSQGDLANGAVVSVTENRVRVRSLPIGRT